MDNYLKTKEAKEEYRKFKEWKIANPDSKSSMYEEIGEEESISVSAIAKGIAMFFQYEFANVFLTDQGSKQDYELVRIYYPELVKSYEEARKFMDDIYNVILSSNTSYLESVRLKRILKDFAQARRHVHKEIYSRWSEIGESKKYL